MGIVTRGPLAVAAFALVAAMLSPDRIIRLFSRFDEADQARATPGGSSPELDAIRALNVSAALAAPFLVVITPRDPKNPPNSAWLAQWLTDNAAAFRKLLFRHGGLVFRGFDVPDAQGFESVALSVAPDLATAYLGTSPRSSINGTRYVHTAADFQQHRTLPVHLEMSFRDKPPPLQMFYANKVDHIAGGETPLTDFQGVLHTLESQEAFRKRIETSRVQYTRNNDDCSNPSKVDPMMQKCWQEMYKTDDRAAVKKKCEAESFECTFDESGRLRMVNSQPWIRKHPVTGEEVFFVHINVLVKESMVYDYERTAVLWGGWRGLVPLAYGLYYRALFAGLSLFWPEASFGSSSAFGDGTPITQQEFYEVKRAIWKNTVQQPYQVRDIVVVDNMRVGHGREMYMGAKLDRQIFTAWTDDYPAGWIA